MPSVDNNLFPPIIKTRMPAFLRDQVCRVYFSLSQYNSPSDILNCQVRITYQNNNKSAFDYIKYPSGIKICALQIDRTITTDDKYYVEIDPLDLDHIKEDTEYFDIEQFYKVQIRLTSVYADEIDINSFFTSNTFTFLANKIYPNGDITQTPENSSSTYCSNSIDTLGKDILIKNISNDTYRFMTCYRTKTGQSRFTEWIYKEQYWVPVYNPGEIFGIIVGRNDGKNMTSEDTDAINTAFRYLIYNHAGIDTWLGNNINYFSEWSQTCLIKAISQPHVKILPSKSESTRIQSFVNDYISVMLLGGIYFEDRRDKEHIGSLKVSVYKEDISDDNLLFTSDDQEMINRNDLSFSLTEFIYQANFPRVNNITIYKFKFDIVTNNLYKYTYIKELIIETMEGQPLTAGIEAEPDEENARTKIKISGAGSPLSGKILIIRSSNRDGFNHWETIASRQVNLSSSETFVFYDTIIESGVFYLYGVQKVLEDSKTKAVVTQNPVIQTFPHMYLTTKDQQLKIKFDPQVQSYQHVISESITQTLGSQYPFFRRNANLNYRTFSISGTISFLSDGNALMKASKIELYGDYKPWYDAYNMTHNITPYTDYTYEKDFREKVIEFLYNNDVKLFKSATQGNILVKLTDINFTPNQTLSRMIYSFSCTAHEIDKFNLNNCQKYNII